MNYHAKYLGPDRDAYQSGYPVETLQLCSAALRLRTTVFVSIGVKTPDTWYQSLPHMQSADIDRLFFFFFFRFFRIPDYLYRSKAVYQVREADLALSNYNRVDWSCKNTLFSAL